MHIAPAFRMRFTYHQFVSLLQTVTVWLFHVSAFLTPLFFFRGISDGIELPKLLLWEKITLCIFVAWILATFLTGKFRKVSLWASSFGMLTLVAFGLSAWFSQSRFLSVVGVGGEASFSLLATGTGILFALLAVQQLTELNAFRVARSFVTGVGIAGLFGIFGLLGSSVLLGWMQSSSSTFVGNAYVLGVLLATILPSVAIYAAYRSTVLRVLPKREGFASDLIFFGTAILGAGYLILLSSRTSFSLLTLGLVVACVISFFHKHTALRTPSFIVTVACVVISAVLSFTTFPWHATVPPEISPNITLSTMIASQGLAQHRWFGSGLGTWGQEYTQFHPVEVNQFPFWDATFDRSYNAWLTLLPTVGVVGFVAWILLCLSLLVLAFRAWNAERANPGKAMALAFFASLLFAQSFYHLSLPLVVLFWLTAGWICRGAMHDAKANLHVGEMFSPLIPFVVAGLGCASVLLFALGRIGWSQMNVGQGVALFQNKDTTGVIASFERASALAPWDPYTARTLGEAYVLRALTTLQSKPTSTVLAGAYRDIGTGIEKIVAVRDLMPRDVDTRLLLARTYRSIMPVVKDADVHAIEAYRSAMVLHPATPAIPHELGVLYLELGDKDRSIKGSGATNYAKAKEQFAKALTLKTDYLPTRYMMGVVAEREGRIKDAIASLEGILKAQNKNTGVAFELALLYARAGDALASKTLLEQIVVAEPDNMNARWYLGSLYETAGAKGKALEQIQWIYDHGFSGNSSVAQKLQSLKVGTPIGKTVLPPPLNETP